MALIVLPRMSPANVNTLPRQLSLGWLADAQRSPPPTLPRPTDRQTDKRVKGQVSDAHCRRLNAESGANTSYLMGRWQANYECGARGAWRRWELSPPHRHCHRRPHPPTRSS